LAIIFSFLAGYFDYKTTYIYDWITYPMILSGIVLLFFKADWLVGIITAAAVLIFFYPLYRYGKIGGGDIKYFMGLSLLIPTYQGFVFLLPVFIIAAILAGLFFGVKFIYSFIGKKQYNTVEKKQLILRILFSIIVSFIFSIFVYLMYDIWLTVLVFIVFLISLFVLSFQNLFYLDFAKTIKTKDILEDDIVDLNCLNKKGTKLFDKKLLEQLKKNKVLEVVVYRNLPVFGPFLFLGVIIALFIL